MEYSEREKWTQRVLAYLNHERRRCTYGALAGILGLIPRSVGRRYLGKPRPEASRVVLKATGKPSGYCADQMAEALCDGIDPITCPEELRRRVTEFEHRAVQ